MRKLSEHDSPCWYDDQVSFMQDLDSPKQNSQPNNLPYHHFPYPCKKEMDFPYNLPFQLPLENQKLLQSASNYSMIPNAIEENHAMHQASIMQQGQHSGQQNFQAMFGNNITNEQVADWRALDKYVASQLSQEDASKDNSYSNSGNIFHVKNNSTVEQLRDLDKEEMMPENNASTSNSSSCPIDMWK